MIPAGPGFVALRRRTPLWTAQDFFRDGVHHRNAQKHGRPFFLRGRAAVGLAIPLFVWALLARWIYGVQVREIGLAVGSIALQQDLRLLACYWMYAGLKDCLQRIAMPFACFAQLECLFWRRTVFCFEQDRCVPFAPLLV